MDEQQPGGDMNSLCTGVWCVHVLCNDLHKIMYSLDDFSGNKAHSGSYPGSLCPFGLDLTVSLN